MNGFAQITYVNVCHTQGYVCVLLYARMCVVDPTQFAERIVQYTVRSVKHKPTNHPPNLPETTRTQLNSLWRHELRHARALAETCVRAPQNEIN